MSIADYELDASEPALLERTDELAQERLALAVSHLEAEQFPPPIGNDAKETTTALEQTCLARPKRPCWYLALMKR